LSKTTNEVHKNPNKKEDENEKQIRYPSSRIVKKASHPMRSHSPDRPASRDRAANGV
jgi:hypothetical protein